MNNKQPKALELAHALTVDGWKNIYNVQHDTMNEAADELIRLHTVNQKLASFVSYYAICPCCNQQEECLDGCTFEEDDPNAYDVMQEAREAMK